MRRTALIFTKSPSIAKKISSYGPPINSSWNPLFCKIYDAFSNETSGDSAKSVANLKIIKILLGSGEVIHEKDRKKVIKFLQAHAPEFLYKDSASLEIVCVEAIIKKYLPKGFDRNLLVT